MLYVFDGLSQAPNPHGLGAGGLQFCIEEVEKLGEIVHDSAIQYRRDGVLNPDFPEEMLYPVDYRISDRLVAQGITWDWFPDHFTFGNGVWKHNTTASPDYKVVVHGTNLNLEEFLAEHGTTRLAELELERMHVRHESWQAYEARWLPGTCPRYAHVVQLVWIVTPFKLPEFAYERIRDIVEDSAELKDRARYSESHFSPVRQFTGASK